MQKRLSRLYVEVLHYFAGIFPLFTQVSGTGPWKFIILRVEMLQQVYRGFFLPFHRGSQPSTGDHSLAI